MLVKQMQNKKINERPGKTVANINRSFIINIFVSM
jgi:hypothetical protein